MKTKELDDDTWYEQNRHRYHIHAFPEAPARRTARWLWLAKVIGFFYIFSAAEVRIIKPGKTKDDDSQHWVLF